ncbi:hypothetical protein [Pseudoalteromonas phage vB_PtuP_Slicky01]|nr:hypothetical protein [Pseudoalteromonas phage vB_PtuP_Slicky01]
MTFLEYVNIVLGEINEVPMSEQQLPTARGLHQFTKNAVNRAYLDIINTPDSKWPWLQVGDLSTAIPAKQLSGENTIITTGDEWYPIPVTDPYKDVVDWENIYLVDPKGNRLTVKAMTWTDFSDYLDLVSNVAGEPQFIVQSADGRSMGLYPNSDTTYQIKFRLWVRPARFQFASDIVPIPDQFSNVLVNGATHYVWRFRENLEQANFSFQMFERGVKDMKRIFSNQSLRRLRWK